MAIDVKWAYFYARATRLLFIHIPKEDKEEGDEKKVARFMGELWTIAKRHMDAQKY